MKLRVKVEDKINSFIEEIEVNSDDILVFKTDQLLTSEAHRHMSEIIKKSIEKAKDGDIPILFLDRDIDLKILNLKENND